MSTSSQIIFERRGPIGQLVLNRHEKRNAQTFEMWKALRLLGQELLADPGELAVVVVSGAGGFFSSGIDTSIFTSGALLTGTVDGKEVQEAFSWLRAGQFISIASIEKCAIGAGLELALWCDMRLATEGTILSLPEVEFGIIPDLGGCSLLAEICGYGRAVDLITTARRIDEVEAHRIGLVNEIVAREKIHQRVDELAKLLCKRTLSSLRGAKRATVASLPDPNHSLAVSQEALHDCIREISRRSQGAKS